MDFDRLSEHKPTRCPTRLPESNCEHETTRFKTKISIISHTTTTTTLSFTQQQQHYHSHNNNNIIIHTTTTTTLSFTQQQQHSNNFMRLSARLVNLSFSFLSSIRIKKVSLRDTSFIIQACAYTALRQIQSCISRYLIQFPDGLDAVYRI